MRIPSFQGRKNELQVPVLYSLFTRSAAGGFVLYALFTRSVGGGFAPYLVLVGQWWTLGGGGSDRLHAYANMAKTH